MGYGQKKGHRLVTLSVIRLRLERRTVCLEGRCSIQLSYRTPSPDVQDPPAHPVVDAKLIIFTITSKSFALSPSFSHFYIFLSI